MFSDPWTSGSPYNFPPLEHGFHGNWTTIPVRRRFPQEQWVGKGEDYTNNHLLHDDLWFYAMQKAGVYAAHHEWPSPFFAQGRGRVYNPFDGNCALRKDMMGEWEAEERTKKLLEADRIKRIRAEPSGAVLHLKGQCEKAEEEVDLLVRRKGELESAYGQAFEDSDVASQQALSQEIARLETERIEKLELLSYLRSRIFQFEWKIRKGMM